LPYNELGLIIIMAGMRPNNKQQSRQERVPIPRHLP